MACIKRGRLGLDLVITEGSLKYLLKIIEEFKDVYYKENVRKGSKHMPTDTYLYPSRQLAKMMMINFRGSVITQNMSTKKMNNSRGLVRRQNMSNQRGCYTDKSK